MRRVVVDASVAVKWLLPFPQNEADVDKALALFEKIAQFDVVMIQPPHFIAEVMAVITRLEPDYANAILLAVSNLEMTISDGPEFYQTAIKLSVELNHHLFDTLYHATALTTKDTTLIAADEAYYRKAKDYGQIVLLQDYCC
jgi:predicted nucleic acid-binding protein